jgi:transposase-like protein
MPTGLPLGSQTPDREIMRAPEEVSMSSKRYTPDFRTEAIRQVTERGYPVSEVAGRLGSAPILQTDDSVGMRY